MLSSLELGMMKIGNQVASELGIGLVHANICKEAKWRVLVWAVALSLAMRLRSHKEGVFRKDKQHGGTLIQSWRSWLPFSLPGFWALWSWGISSNVWAEKESLLVLTSEFWGEKKNENVYVELSPRSQHIVDTQQTFFYKERNKVGMYTAWEMWRRSGTRQKFWGSGSANFGGWRRPQRQKDLNRKLETDSLKWEWARWAVEVQTPWEQHCVGH